MNSKSKYLSIIFLFAILDFCLLIYIKYSSNNIPISDFDLFKTGNILNFLFTILLTIACILNYLQKVEINLNHFRFLSLVSLIYIIPLLVIVIMNSFDIVFIDDYLFGYPFRKILPAILFITNQIIFLFVLFSLWYLYSGQSLIAYLFSAVSIILTIIILLGATLVYSFSVAEYDELSKNKSFNYGIILGAAVWSNNEPSPIFTGRINKGAILLKNNVVEKIQLTGGNAPGELSEARAALNYLKIKHDIAQERIEIEESTSTTNEQVRYIKDKSRERDSNHNYLFISDEFHIMRISEMADFYDLDAKVISSEYQLNFQKSLYYRFRDSIGLILFWLFSI